MAQHAVRSLRRIWLSDSLICTSKPFPVSADLAGQSVYTAGAVFGIGYEIPAPQTVQ